MEGKLYGLGVGPGDPELLTLKSKRILEEVDLICTPQSQPNKSSLALEIITEVVDCGAKIEPFYFPMTSDQDQLEAAWGRIGKKVIRLLEQGYNLALITIGDPLFYSTYSYILDRIVATYPDQVETIAGVTSVSACSSRLNLPLVQGDEKLAIIPVVDDLTEIRQALLNFENIVLLKVSRNYKELIELLAELDLKESAIYVSRCGQPEEFITSDLDSLRGEKIDYLSQIIVKKR